MALSGDGCGALRTKCLDRLGINFSCACACDPQSRKTICSCFNTKCLMIASVNVSQPLLEWDVGSCALTVRIVFSSKTPCVAHFSSDPVDGLGCPKSAFISLKDVDQAWWTYDTWRHTKCQSHGLPSIMIWILPKYHDSNIGGLGTEDGPIEDEVFWWVDLFLLRTFLVEKGTQLDKVWLASLPTYHYPPTCTFQARQFQGAPNLFPSPTLQHPQWSSFESQLEFNPICWSVITDGLTPCNTFALKIFP